MRMRSFSPLAAAVRIGPSLDRGTRFRMAYATALLHPPMRLRALADRTAKWLRTTWAVLFGLAIVCVLVSAVYAVRANYWTQPVIAQFQLDFFVATDGEL